MRKITLFWIFLVSLFVWVLASVFGVISSEFSGVFFLLSFLPLIVMGQFQYFINQPFGYARWVNQVLKLFKILSLLEKQNSLKENKQVKDYLEQEFDPFTVKLKYRYYLTFPSKELDLDKVCAVIKLTTTSNQKLRIVQKLIKIALVDRLLSDKELSFIKKATRKIGIHQRTLKAILALHTYITEQDIKSQQRIRPSSTSYRISRAYQVLGLDENASLEEVKDSYRELAKIYHPDKLLKSQNKEKAKQQFLAITNAYEVIKTSKAN